MDKCNMMVMTVTGVQIGLIMGSTWALAQRVSEPLAAINKMLIIVNAVFVIANIITLCK